MAKKSAGKKPAKKTKAPQPEPTLRDLVGAYVAAQATMIMDDLPRLRARDEDALVSSAEAVRRLRSTLRTCEELIDIPRSAQFDDDLAWYAGRIERLLDLDLVSARVADAIAALPVELVVGRVSAQLQTELQLSRKDAWDDLATEVDAERAHALVAQLHQWRSDTPFTAEADRPAKKINPIRKRTVERAERRRDTARAAAAHDPHVTAPDTVVALDRALQATRRLHHLQELIDGSTTSDAGPDVVEEHRLSLLTSGLLREIGIRVGVRSGHNGFSYGLLFADERRRQRDLADLI